MSCQGNTARQSVMASPQMLQPTPLANFRTAGTGPQTHAFGALRADAGHAAEETAPRTPARTAILPRGRLRPTPLPAAGPDQLEVGLLGCRLTRVHAHDGLYIDDPRDVGTDIDETATLLHAMLVLAALSHRLAGCLIAEAS